MQINLSKIISNDGNTVITHTILTIAPLDIKVHSEPIISIFEYAPTPKVAPKKQSPLTAIELIEVPNASPIASCLLCPFFLPFIYLFVISIA